jgi:flavin-dependent dehydrogenase
VVEAITRFHDAMYVAEKMRAGRVLLVGESVRVHYPVSGVGMNFCIQDAFNLGWKLAAVVTGRAEDALLDTYEQERRPEIEALLDDVRRQCAVQFNFDDEHEALKRFLSEAVNRKLCENLSGLSVRYAFADATHSIVGTRFPDLALAESPMGARSVFAALATQDFPLVDVDQHGIVPAPAGLRLKVASLAPHGSRMDLKGVLPC